MSDLDMKPQPGLCGQCGRPLRLDTVTVDLRHNRIHFRGAWAKLSPTQAEIAFVLARHMPDVVPKATILIRLWGASAGRAADDDRQLQFQIWGLRKRIRPLGLGITSSIGVGYYLHLIEPDSGEPTARLGRVSRTVRESSPVMATAA